MEQAPRGLRGDVLTFEACLASCDLGCSRDAPAPKRQRPSKNPQKLGLHTWFHQIFWDFDEKIWKNMVGFGPNWIWSMGGWSRKATWTLDDNDLIFIGTKLAVFHWIAWWENFQETHITYIYSYLFFIYLFIFYIIHIYMMVKPWFPVKIPVNQSVEFCVMTYVHMVSPGASIPSVTCVTEAKGNSCKRPSCWTSFHRHLSSWSCGTVKIGRDHGAVQPQGGIAWFYEWVF